MAAGFWGCFITGRGLGVITLDDGLCAWRRGSSFGSVFSLSCMIAMCQGVRPAITVKGIFNLSAGTTVRLGLARSMHESLQVLTSAEFLLGPLFLCRTDEMISENKNERVCT